MDDYLQFVAFGRRYLTDKQSLRKQKIAAMVGVPFSL
jgi:hypothetical protein